MPQTKNKKTKKDFKSHLKSGSSFVKYTGIASQMLAVILGLTFLGVYIDKYFELAFPVFTFILSILSIIIAMYWIIKQVLNSDK